MMSSLRQWHEKIQAKRKGTPWRQFLLEIASWKNIGFYNHSGTISRYPLSARVREVDMLAFVSQQDGLVQHGPGWDVSQGFWQQFGQLVATTPLPRVVHMGENENCDYCDIASGAKNCYLSFTAFNACENIAYSESVKDHCRNVYNSMTVRDGCENIYQSSAVFRSRDIFYSRYVTDSYQLWFCSNMSNCQECLLCDGLDNQSYCIHNQRLTKEAYLARKAELLADKDAFASYYAQVNPVSRNDGSSNVSGNSLIKSGDIEQGHFVYRVQGGRNVFSVGCQQGNREFYDVVDAGSPHGQDFYGIMGAGASEHIYCSVSINICSHCYYSYYLTGCSFCLGCVGLRNQQFCILNKQYSKEEWYEKVDEIFGNMESDGVLGDFLPGSVNPFYFNDTAAYLIDDSFSKEEVTRIGYLWRDEEIRVGVPQGVEVVRSGDLGRFELLSSCHPGTECNEGNPGSLDDQKRFPPSREGQSEHEGKIDPTVLKVVIQDDDGNLYRVIPMEYKFLVKHGLPLPREHWMKRLKGHFNHH